MNVMQGAEDQAQRLRLVLRAGGFGTWVWDRPSGRISWDPELEAVFGLPPGEFPGTYEAWLARLHPDDRDQVVGRVEDAMARRGTYDIRHRIVWPDGSVRWVQGLGQVTVDADGQPTGTIGCTRDVTDQHALEQQLVDVAQQAVLSAGRAERLQSVTAELAGALTVQDVTRTLAAQLEGILGASSAAVALLSPRGASLRIVTSFGYDPDLVRDFARVPLTELTPMTDSVRAGVPVIVSAADLAHRYPQFAELPEVTGHSLLVALPLQVPGRRLGALLLAFSDRIAISEEELQVIAAVAGQCSQALDRARLIERLGEVALTLQQGLAPGSLPELPGFEVAAVYQAGGDEMEHLGGDWYDVIDVGRGRFVLVIGDVMGRGVSASTTMTRVRTAARAYAWDDPNPVVVMAKLDAFIGREAPDDFVTMIYATLDAGTGVLGIVNAGHLPAVLHTRGRPGRLLPAALGLPLGLTTSRRSIAAVELAAGDALLLFTDGLVERRDRDIDTGLTTLTESCSWAPDDATLQDLLDGLVRELVADQAPGDDVTALMIRRHPADDGQSDA